MTNLPSRWNPSASMNLRLPMAGDPAHYGLKRPSQFPEYWRVIRSHFVLIFSLVLVGVLAGWLATMLQRPLYQAKTALDIRSLNENFLNPREGAATGTTESVLPESYIQTEIKILSSESLRQRALSQIKPPPEIANPNTNPPFWQSALDWLKPRVAMKSLIADAGRRVKVRAVGNTRIVEVFCEAWDGQLAAVMCNTLARAYIEHNLESRSASSKETSEWLQSQLDDVRRRLTTAENDLKDAGKDAALGLASTVDVNPAAEKLRQLQTEIARIQAERFARESSYTVATSQDANSLPSELDSGPIREYRMRLAEAQRQLREANVTMTPEHYKVRELSMQVADLEAALKKERTDLVSRLKSDLETVLHRESLLTTAYEQAAVQVSNRDDKAVRYNMLKREVDSERQLYETLLQKVGEVGLAAALRTSTITVVDPAIAPLSPYAPSELADIGIGFCGGAALGVVFALFRFRSDRTLRAPGEATVHLQLRELGVIPTMRRRRLLGGGPRRKSQRRIVDVDAFQDADGAGRPVKNDISQIGPAPVRSIALATWLRVPEMVEAVTATMNSLIFTDHYSDEGRVIVLTSPEVGDGKTTVAANLAIAMAQIGRRVVLVDGDLRKPQLHSIFGEAPEFGLDTLLEEPGEPSLLSQSLRETKIQNLWVIPTSPVREGISRKLHSPRMRSLLKELRKEFDVILIDTPPMQHISDARVLGWMADGVLLVFRAGKTTKEAALAVHDCLTQDGILVLGTILNDWNPSRGDRYSAYSAYFRVA
jgi:succinoglycan biosynthesis transport protein ExoP